MRVSFQPYKQGFRIKVNGIAIYYAASQPEAMKATNLIEQGKFLAVFKALYKNAKKGGYLGTMKSNARLILQYVCAVRGIETKSYFGGNNIFAGSQLNAARMYGII